MQIYINERADLLERAVRLLKRDRRIVAAWLYGSMGRGTQDRWSDTDLWIVVADEHMEALRAERQKFISRVGAPILTIEAPQNAPPGGAYLLAMYPGTNGPHILDCSWQSLSSARRPSDTTLLFERKSIPTAASSDPPPIEARLEKAVARTRFFWMMTTIVAKYVARNDTWEVLGLLAILASVFREIEWLVGNHVSPPGYHGHPDFPPPTTSSAQLASLRRIVDAMKYLMQDFPALRGAIGPEVDEQIDLFLGFIENDQG